MRRHRERPTGTGRGVRGPDRSSSRRSRCPWRAPKIRPRASTRSSASSAFTPSSLQPLPRARPWRTSIPATMTSASTRGDEPARRRRRAAHSPQRCVRAPLLKSRLGSVGGADTAAVLDRDAERPEPHDQPEVRHTRTCSFEVDDVHELRPLGGPVLHDGDGIVRVSGDGVVVTLCQPNGHAVEDIDRRYHLHLAFPSVVLC